jgi:hypothetical protein
LSDLIVWLLDKDPAARPQSAAEVAARLRRIRRELRRPAASEPDLETSGPLDGAPGLC